MFVDPAHPLLRPNHPTYWIPPMTGCGSAINIGIEMNRHGILIGDVGRVGKSTLTEMLERYTHWRNYAMTWNCVLPGKPSHPCEGYFFAQLGLALGLKIRERILAPFVVEQITNHLAEQASRENADVIVLAFDDGNRLHRSDYDHLVTLDNRIRKRGFRLFSVIILQTDADQSEVPISTTALLPSQITGRFAADYYPYTGLRGEEDILTAFNSFLSQTWNGRTFLEEFAPHLHELGWKANDLAADFWRVAQEVRKEEGLPPSEPFPMLCFDTASYYLLVRVAGEDPQFEQFRPDHIAQALLVSNLVQLERSRHPLKTNATSPALAGRR